MKNLKVLCMIMLCMATILVSCSGEDGEQGPKGNPGESIKGDAGDPGDDGLSCWDTNNDGKKDDSEDINQDGEWNALDCQGEQGDAGDPGDPGQDGNANVEQHTFNLDLFGNYEFIELDLNNIVDEPANYAYLFYLVDENNFYHLIPGQWLDTGISVSVSMVLDPESEFYGYLSIGFLDSDGNLYQVNGSPFPELIVVAIELSNTGKTSENIMAELKDAGVDTSDYYAVADYFGLVY